MNRSDASAGGLAGPAAISGGTAPGQSQPRRQGSHASVDQWIKSDAIPFVLDQNKGVDAAIDRLMRVLGDEVSLLGVGEALHGGEEFFTLRNRLFERLVQAHGYSAITIEITDTRARLVDDYIHGRGPATYEGIQDSGFSYGAGLYAGNRALVEWMKRYNADPAHKVKLSFYGSLPSEQGETTESPRRALESVFAYLQSADPALAARQKDAIQPLIGQDSDWEEPAKAAQAAIMAKLMSGDKSPATSYDTKAYALSPKAQSLRLAVENLAFELQMRRPELVAKSGSGRFNDALHDVGVARNLLALHVALIQRASLDTLVSMRDAMAGEHMLYVTDREKERGKVMIHLHNAHLRRTQTKLPWYEFWPTGAHLETLFGERCAIIGGGVGTSEQNFIGTPEAGSLEARLLARGTDCFLPTGRGKKVPDDALAAMPVRSRATRPYITYEPLFPQSIADLDAIAFLRTATHTRGMPPWPG